MCCPCSCGGRQELGRTALCWADGAAPHVETHHQKLQENRGTPLAALRALRTPGEGLWGQHVPSLGNQRADAALGKQKTPHCCFPGSWEKPHVRKFCRENRGRSQELTGKKNHVLEYTFPGCFKLQTHRFTLPVLNCLLVVFNDCWWNEKFHAGSMSTSSGWFLENRHEKSSKLELSVSLLMIWWSVKLQCSLYLPTDECLPLARSTPFLGIYFGFLLICFKGIIIFFTLLIILLFLDLF